ncbi:hypothetical protein C3747_91g96 [Trypanosoma cruzi]|uniref:Uncharacterized protein n=2 Tax=Trypanosoma cruzi TaxID=5693 RepID=Q4CX11_TRYCC|nr:hypothetical protein, conserved [Trypanosoma cruzi]EAN84811.1 hypothetical protein, conserved [Trypanosoma cruzi]KAF8291646.1 hypothetical protein TcYC6_0121780 [Trypanosoma cruzi]PWV08345.1 hypothetical protein C3747_91g96 [Trypanosoma cruzi]RNC55611.1 hypothetical protein TcCL_ESM06879 [Trypanosoma cruzi]|eukprot:XP_806662.1 hypothetical protein [Trypanosoma cruzi strain CL Brener]
MLCSLVEFFLWVVACVQPLFAGVQLCRSAREGRSVDAALITNLTLAMILFWLLELLDVLFLSYLLSMRTLYISARVIFSLYLLHPRFCGATRVYNRFLASSVAYYAPLVDGFVVRHLVELEHSGFICYLGNAGRSLMLISVDLLDVASQLVFSASKSTGPSEKKKGAGGPDVVESPTVPPQLSGIFFASKQ